VVAIAFGPFLAKPDLAIASLALTGTIYQVSIGNLLCIRSPSMRQDSIFGNVTTNEDLGQAELASAIAFQETHQSDWISRTSGKGILNKYLS
jgi:hypothetical protein